MANAQPGDLIEIDRGLYQHWAVYIGNGEVIHVGAVGNVDSGALLNGIEVEVKKERLKDVVGDNDCRINNTKHHGVKARPPSQIVQAAHASLGKRMRYNVATNNCEHFATEMRYGKAMSAQVQRAAVSGSSVMASSILSSVLPGGGVASPSSYMS